MREVTLLDGGMGKALEELGAPFRQPEWSALALIEAPEYVTRAHEAFIDAGAEVIITNNYAVVPFHLGDSGFEEAGDELVDLAGRLARSAADRAAGVRVAGSIPPLFGSYEPARFEPQRAPTLLGRIASALAPHVDLFVAETQSCVAEAGASLSAAAGFDLPRWVSATLEDGGGPGGVDPWVEAARLRSGETVADLCRVAIEGGAEAVLFNCSQPEVMTEAVRRARALLPDDVAVGAYANAFDDKPEIYAANEVILGHRRDIEGAGFNRFVGEWIDAGATLVGGCCGVMPRHIAAVRRFLDG